MDVRTIITLSRFAVSKKEVDAAEDCENIAAKTVRFKDAFLLLGDNLSKLLSILTAQNILAEDIIQMSKKDLEYEGWYSNERLFKMAKVAPLDMSQDDFLSRCKTVNELFNQIPIGPLKKIALSSGINSDDIKNFRSIKLLHGIKNILDYLFSNHLKISDFKDYPEELKWTEENPSTLGLFVLNDLRQIDAHDKSGNPLNDDNEKFVIFLANSDEKGTKTVAGRLSENIKKLSVKINRKQNLDLTVSMGACSSKHAKALTDLISGANKALDNIPPRSKIKIQFCKNK